MRSSVTSPQPEYASEDDFLEQDSKILENIFYTSASTSEENEKHLRITDRSFGDVLLECRLDENTIKNLPQKAIVVDAGSGTNQIFLHELIQNRKDIIPVAVDLSLAIPTRTIETGIVSISITKDNEHEIVDYFLTQNQPKYIKKENVLDTEKAVEFHQLRVASAKEVNAVAMDLRSPGFPLSGAEGNGTAGGVDMWVDCNGPFMYIEQPTDKINYLESVVQMLKPKGGIAYLAPISKDTFRCDSDWGMEDPYYALVRGLVEKMPDIKITVQYEWVSRKYYNMSLKVERNSAYEKDKDIDNRLKTVDYRESTTT